MFLLVASVLLYGSASGMELKNKTGELAPDFSLVDLGGNTVRLSDYRGKAVVVFFWTTWCLYCREQLVILNEKFDAIAKDGVVLLAVNVGESKVKIESFTRTKNFKFSILSDRDSSVADAYGLLGVPTYFFIDRDGKVRFSRNRFSEGLYKELL
jgi:peroxiredoxin